jgi:hypothetical protein
MCLISIPLATDDSEERIQDSAIAAVDHDINRVIGSKSSRNSRRDHPIVRV